MRLPQTDYERAILLREALKHKSAAAIARYFRQFYTPGKVWNAERVRLHAKTGGYDDWRAPHFQRIVEEGRARAQKKGVVSR